MFREVSAKVSYPKMEEGVIELWRRIDAFGKIQELRRGGPTYTFYEGPPTANGLPHIGHVLPRSVKDLFPRYKTMLGYYVPRKAGWDTHGLPVELEVEKRLGITSKPDIEKYGVARFIAECKKSVWKYEKEWEKLTERIGFWLDLDHAYVTYHTEYIESVWWALKRIWDKGWLYQGYRVVPYCARCGTSLSSHEVAQGYADVEEPSVYVRFPLVSLPDKTRGGADGGTHLAGLGEDAARGLPVSLLVWTTTPWTLPSNTAVAAHPDVDYTAVIPEGGDEILVVAAALAPKVFPQGYRALHTIKGRDLAGHRYRPPFSFFDGAVEQGLRGGAGTAAGRSAAGSTAGSGAGSAAESAAGSAAGRTAGRMATKVAEGATGEAGEVDWSKVFTVLPAGYVTLEDGTGLVHSSPAFGEDDMNTAREHRLPIFRPVDANGKFTSEVGPWRGLFVKDADPAITDALRDSGRLYRSELYRHTYPFCYRCDTPLLYYADTGWFIKMTAVKEELIRISRDEVAWYPEHIREGRFGDWLENLVDWNLSRSRYWGTPLPIWECGGGGNGAAAGDATAGRSPDGARAERKGCGHRLCIGSVDELRRLAKPETVPEPFDPHRPYVDRVVLTCPECGGEMRRVPELIDVWFDSGSMPFAQWHFPFENRESFEKHFPADFICEAIDQTRGWFYSLLAISTVLFNKPAFENVVVTEFGVDEQGRKMSKHIGNVLDPWEILNVQGADALRWFLYAVSHPWFQKRFSPRVISEFQSRMQDTLWNVYSFFVLYANLDRFEPDAAAALAAGVGLGSGPCGGAAGSGPRGYCGRSRLGGREVTIPAPAERGPLDRWILARLNQVVGEVRDNLDHYEVLPATRAIEGFIDDLSNWYVRRGRRRYWRAGTGTDTDTDKVAAYQTLYEVLLAVVRLLAPFTPFTTEELYQNLARAGAGDGAEGAGGENSRAASSTGAVSAASAGSAGAIPESVHHCLYPEADKTLVDEDLLRRMEILRAYVVLARAARNRAGIRTRQPLKRVVLVGPKADAAAVRGLVDLLADEVNVKEVTSGDDLSLFAVHAIKARFSILGPRLGPLAPQVAKALARLGPEGSARAARRLAAGQTLEVQVEGQEVPVVLGPDDVEVRTDPKRGWSVEGEEGRYVALDTEISDVLLLEGLAREMVNRVQRMRKEAGFDVDDHIDVVYEAAGDAERALASARAYVAGETLADRFEQGQVPCPAGGLDQTPKPAPEGWFVQVLDLEGDEVKIAIRKAE